MKEEKKARNKGWPAGQTDMLCWPHEKFGDHVEAQVMTRPSFFFHYAFFTESSHKQESHSEICVKTMALKY